MKTVKIITVIALIMASIFLIAVFAIRPGEKGVSYKEGGGYKVNFGGDGILMYHPEKRSHHKGAYYKISTGKGGTHRYDTKGNEIE